MEAVRRASVGAIQNGPPPVPNPPHLWIPARSFWRFFKKLNVGQPEIDKIVIF